MRFDKVNWMCEVLLILLGFSCAIFASYFITATLMPMKREGHWMRRGPLG